MNLFLSFLHPPLNAVQNDIVKFEKNGENFSPRENEQDHLSSDNTVQANNMQHLQPENAKAYGINATKQ